MDVNRPQYETEENRKNERSVIADFCRLMGPPLSDCTPAKPPNRYQIDFGLYDKSTKLRAFAEVKCCGRATMEKEKHGYMVALDKAVALRRYAMWTKVPGFLVVRFTDRLMYIDTADIESPPDVRNGGRIVATRDEQDLEPCVFIPIRLFKGLT